MSEGLRAHEIAARFNRPVRQTLGRLGYGVRTGLLQPCAVVHGRGGNAGAVRLYRWEDVQEFERRCPPRVQKSSEKRLPDGRPTAETLARFDLVWAQFVCGEVFPHRQPGVHHVHDAYTSEADERDRARRVRRGGA